MGDNQNKPVELDPTIEASLRTLQIQNTLVEAKKPEEIIMREVARCNYCEDATFAIKLALEEAMTNAVKHGNRNDPTKKITVRYCVNKEQAVILVCDQGPGFAPDAVPNPTDPDRIALPNGRGIMLMRAYMTNVFFRQDGAEVCLVKRNE